MKRNLVLTTLTLMLAAAAPALSFGQEAGNRSNPFSTEEVKEAYELRSINAAFNKNKVYVSWTAVDATGECVYIIERSADGVNYQKISAKKGAPSPGNNALMFSFIDEQPVPGTSYYRVVRAGISENLTSAAVAVKSEPVKKESNITSDIASNK